MSTLKALQGDDLRRMVAAATLALECNVEAVNAMNVFPVPDGDTGTNMFLTLRAVDEHLRACADGTLEAIARALAKGALLGARGNSGVILSQFFRGLARALEGKREATPHDVACALEEGARAAYKAVGKPVEGTMLTVIREAAAGAQAIAAQRCDDMATLVEGALEASKEALARTPELLPVLKEAGVVDAGGQGFVLILEGALRLLRGEDPAQVRLEGIATPLGGVRETFLTATEEVAYGYCTQFLVQGNALDVDQVRERLGALADSTVVVGDETLLKVHVHVADPGPVLSYAVSLGTIGQVKIENIDEQHREFLLAQRARGKARAIDVVAVGWGPGLERVLLNLGATRVVAGGQTMNPSCQELLEAVEAVPSERVVVLPNNSNVIPAAQQAAALTRKTVEVVPSRSIPQGIAALLAYNPEFDLEANLAAMKRAYASVRTGEVVSAVRGTEMSGISVRAGQVIGLLEGELVVAREDRVAALEEVVRRAEAGEGNLVTLYWGGETTAQEAQEASARLRAQWPGLEVEVVHGGQPYYHYILSIE